MSVDRAFLQVLGCSHQHSSELCCQKSIYQHERAGGHLVGTRFENIRLPALLRKNTPAPFMVVNVLKTSVLKGNVETRNVETRCHVGRSSPFVPSPRRPDCLFGHLCLIVLPHFVNMSPASWRCTCVFISPPWSQQFSLHLPARHSIRGGCPMKERLENSFCELPHRC